MKQGKFQARGSIILLIFTLGIGLAGCGNKESAPVPSDNQVRVQEAHEAAKKKIDNPKKVAAHLESLARSVKGVNGATCVVFGNYAIVGIDVEDTMERSRVGTLKYSVAEAFRRDPYGIDAVVTADLDLAQRLREIKVDIKNGRPIAGFTDELGDMIGRLVPQIPRNIMPPKAPEDMGTATMHKH